MAGRDDLKINARVRAVLARHWVDLTRVTFAAVNGTVRLSGVLKRLSTEEESSYFSEEDVLIIEQELRSIPGVRRVYIDLENWKKDASTSRWSPVGGRRGKAEGEDQEDEEGTD